ncbi:TonB C-terminal domain-containing protein [Shinella pollutisoli]|uniref:TonB C-terminal domain-containing protein n=1 Tax=Shinella pollutisoli TaxID=2250594 RepID=A0ABV7DIL0_9HYPH|nr:TonB C-terminal domain-containing protein [Shinella pollutisoli]
MKGSLATSAALHALVLTWALVSLGAPESFDVADVEALPVDIVSIEELTQIQQGDKKAEAKEKAAPVPTKKETPVENAENVGDNDIDLKNLPTPEEKPREIETAAAPEKAEKVVQTPDTKPVEEVKQEEPASEPSTEVAAIPEAKQEVKPDPTPDAKPAEEAPAEDAEAEALPDKVPVPVMKPKIEQAQAQTAKTPERKKEEKKKQEKASSVNDSDFNADEIAALLNKEKASGEGAKSSQEQAALGGKKTTSGTKLTMSEMDALRGQIQNNWSIIPGLADAADVRIKVTMQLDQNGDIIGEPEVVATGGSESARRALAGGAKRAIMKSRPFKGLPPEKYDAWSEVVVNFDPSEMM